MATFLSSVLGGKQPPPQVETDLVFPLRFFDDNTTLRGIVMAWTFRFDDVLDANKLQAAVSHLLDMPSWRHLGGRLRLNKSRKLELHVPAQFTTARPSMRFSHVELEMELDHHSLASRLPRSTTGPSLHAGPSEFELFAAGPGAPRKLDNYLHSDEPQIAVHVTSFTDATLVSFSCPHTMTDAMGFSALLAAISLVLVGRASDVPDLPNPARDVLGDIGKTEDDHFTEPYLLAHHRIGGLPLVRFGLKYAWDMLWRPNMQHHTGFLPASFIAKLRAAAEADLLNDASGSKPAFLSDGDILVAWGTLMILASEPRPRPAIILNVLNVRGRFPSTIATAATQGAFVQNLTFPSYTLLSTENVRTATLGSVAAKVRLALTQQTTEPQLQAMVRESRASFAATGNPPLFGDPDARLIVVTNWEKARLFDSVDFSPALVGSPRPDRDPRLPPPGRLTYHYAHNLNQGAPRPRHFWNIIGKDLKGNYWYSGALLPESWQAIERAIIQP